MTWIFSMLRVAASLVCTKTVKVQPEEMSIQSRPGHTMPATRLVPPSLASSAAPQIGVETKC